LSRAEPRGGPCLPPSARENEIDGIQAWALVKGGCSCVPEGANMPPPWTQSETTRRTTCSSGRRRLPTGDQAIILGVRSSPASPRLPTRCPHAGLSRGALPTMSQTSTAWHASDARLCGRRPSADVFSPRAAQHCILARTESACPQLLTHFPSWYLMEWMLFGQSQLGRGAMRG